MITPNPTAPDDDRADGHVTDASDAAEAIGPADDGMAPLVNNTGEDPAAGDDADAASG